MINIIILFISFITSMLLTKALIPFAKYKRFLDIPNTRSFHKEPTPTGGGWVFAIIVIPVALSFSIINPYVTISCLVLLATGWIDDLKEMNSFIKLILQVLAILISIHSLPESGYLPAFLEKSIIFIAWLWFVNLYNFMDGINGITASETSCISLGVILVSIFSAIPNEWSLLSTILLGVSLGFLVYNWQPAKIFPGDTGSLFLGFIVGFMLINIALSGYLIVALILPMYYLMDTTIILIKRIINRERIWEPHQNQFFHRSILKVKRSHAQTVVLIIACNMYLIGLALLSSTVLNPLLCLVLAIVICSMFLKIMITEKRFDLIKSPC